MATNAPKTTPKKAANKTAAKKAANKKRTGKKATNKKTAAKKTAAKKATNKRTAAAAETGGHMYTMTVDLSVIEALGINLYSNAAAVLSELVANAYDADATCVTISWKQNGQKIVVTDNGTGMTVAELNKRFLTVGYKKRTVEGSISPRWKRPYMGRKGIGKLSVFSIAQTVTVYSTKGKTSSGLRIRVKDLLDAITAGKPYHPEPVTVPDDYAHQGTTLILTNLKSTRAGLTAAALRKRLARRFDVLDQTEESEGGFYIVVNDKAITYADRQELKKLEFIWEFGQKTLPTSALPDGITRFVIKNNVVDAAQGWKIQGWFGTAKVPTDLTDDPDAGSLKNIIVLARKRPIQEGIVDKLDFSRIFGNYVTGQIEADFLDLDDHDDIATSDRQRLIEDDDRVKGLQKVLRDAFVKAADEWSEHRPKKEVVDVFKKWPQIKKWVDTRPPYQREAANTMLGTVASLTLEKKTEGKERAALFRAGILAFERLGLRQVVKDLDDLAQVTAPELLRLLGLQDSYESALWVDILRSRVEAIDQFRNLTKANEKEKVLQQHLFNHLWLLDASWERAAVGGKMEENLKDIAPGVFATDAEGKQIHGRIDIRYATMGGRHVIVELKRYKVNLDVVTLTSQGLKYYTALASILKKQQKATDNIEVIFVVGDQPKTPGAGKFTPEDYIKNQFASINGRFVTYDALIANAQHQYQEYLDATDKSKELDKLLDSLDPDDGEP